MHTHTRTQANISRGVYQHKRDPEQSQLTSKYLNVYPHFIYVIRYIAFMFPEIFHQYLADQSAPRGSESMSSRTYVHF